MMCDECAWTHDHAHDPVAVPHPTYCPHGAIIGWHHLTDPDTIVSTRMTTPCGQCRLAP